MRDFGLNLAGPPRAVANIQPRVSEPASDTLRPLLEAERGAGERLTPPAGQEMSTQGPGGGGRPHLFTLPEGAVLKILQHLTAGEVKNLASTCKALYRQVEHPDVWLHKYAQASHRSGYRARSQMQPTTPYEVWSARVCPAMAGEDLVCRTLAGCCWGSCMAITCVSSLPWQFGPAVGILACCGTSVSCCTACLCCPSYFASVDRAAQRRQAAVASSTEKYDEARREAASSSTTLRVNSNLDSLDMLHHIDRLRAFCDLAHTDADDVVLVEALRRQHLPAIKTLIGGQDDLDLTRGAQPTELSTIVNAFIDAGDLETAGCAVMCGASLSQPDALGVIPHQRLNRRLTEALRKGRWETVETLCSPSLAQTLTMPRLAELPTTAAYPPASAPHAQAAVKAVLEAAIEASPASVFPRFAGLVAAELDLCGARDALLRRTIVDDRLGDAMVLANSGARLGEGAEVSAVRSFIAARMDEAENVGNFRDRFILARLGR